MKLSLDYSPFKKNTKEKIFISAALKKFLASPLSWASEKDLKSVKKIWTDIKQSHSKIFIFAFGGAGSTAKIINSLFPVKNKSVWLIDSIDKKSLNLLSSLTKAELKQCHSLFISKSGKTKEILFYKSFLKKIYLNNNLSLKKRVTIATQALKSPLLEWIRKEKGSILFLNNPLPGRFSFFTLGGLLQSQAYDFNVPIKKLNRSSSSITKFLEFFIHQCNKKKEIFFCPFSPELKELSHWLELSWSESLFKQKAKKQVPVLRNITLSDLRHSCIEELITKKDQVCFWALDIKTKASSNSFHEKQIKKLLKEKRIPYVFMKFPLNNKNSLVSLMSFFYKILFCIGDFSKSDIYTQPWVDYLKRV